MISKRTLAFEFATGAGEPAGVWIRVSTSGQDEANQVPDIRKRVESAGYNVRRQYVLHDRSASKGEQQDKLNEVVSDIAAGVIKILVCWHSDRLDRRGPKAGYAFLYAVELAGGRVESVLDPDFGKDDIGSEVLTTIRMGAARDETKLKRDRMRIAQDKIKANGAYGNRPSYGYRVAGKEYHKHLEQIPEQIDTVRRIFNLYVSGMSLDEIAALLMSEGIPAQRGMKWNAKVLAAIIKNTIYIGRQISKTTGKITYRCNAVVSVKLFRRANARLDARATRKGVSPKRDKSLLLTGFLYCGTCGNKAYPIKSNMHKHVNPDTGEITRTYATISYYCNAKLGCKICIEVGIIHAELERYLAEHVAGLEIKQEIVIPADDHEDEIEQLKIDMSGLDPEDDDDETRRQELRAEIKRLRALPVEADEIEIVTINGAELLRDWQSLDTNGKREILRRLGLRLAVTKAADGTIRLATFDHDASSTCSKNIAA